VAERYIADPPINTDLKKMNPNKKLILKEQPRKWLKMINPQWNWGQEERGQPGTQ